MEQSPPTLKINEDDEVIILEVVAPPEVKVLDKVPPAQRFASVAITGVVIRAHFGGMVPVELSIRCYEQ